MWGRGGGDCQSSASLRLCLYGQGRMGDWAQMPLGNLGEELQLLPLPCFPASKPFPPSSMCSWLSPKGLPAASVRPCPGQQGRLLESLMYTSYSCALSTALGLWVLGREEEGVYPLRDGAVGRL